MNYMIPTDSDTVELVARAIAKERLHNDADKGLFNTIGVHLSDSATLEESFERIFEMLWGSQQPGDLEQKERYRNDARAAIAAINLKLLTSTQ
jgi:hypothetical protein